MDKDKRNIEIIVGTNEEFLLGYELVLQKDGNVSLKQTFADHSHSGSVRQVVVSGKFFVSGGTDEIIRIFNLNSRTEVGLIMEHQGTITNLAFHGSKYLFSSAQDGNICIFERGKWQCLKTFRAHNRGVTGIAVHPTGKMALSVGQDRSLCTWNLIKGRRAYITNLKKVADSVHWSPAGAHYLVVKASCVDVYEVSTAQMVHSVDFKESICSLVFLTDDIIAVAGEGQNICLYDIFSQLELVQWVAHSMRIKSLRVIPRDEAEEVWLVSASSSGKIKVWRLDLLSLSSTPKCLGEVDTTCRIICMDLSLPLQTFSKAKVTVSDADVESSDGETQDLGEVSDEEGSVPEEEVGLKRKKSTKRHVTEETNGKEENVPREKVGLKRKKTKPSAKTKRDAASTNTVTKATQDVQKEIEGNQESVPKEEVTLKQKKKKKKQSEQTKQVVASTNTVTEVVSQIKEEKIEDNEESVPKKGVTLKRKKNQSEQTKQDVAGTNTVTEAVPHVKEIIEGNDGSVPKKKLTLKKKNKKKQKKLNQQDSSNKNSGNKEVQMTDKLETESELTLKKKNKKKQKKPNKQNTSNKNSGNKEVQITDSLETESSNQTETKRKGKRKKNKDPQTPMDISVTAPKRVKVL